MKFTDRISIGKRIIDSNGFVSVPAVITKVGIQKYHVSELMRDTSLVEKLRGMTGMVNVFRPEDTVFNPLTIDSFKNLPVTVQHPNGGVNTKSAKFVVSGHVGSEVNKIDESRLGATIHLHDEDAIALSFGSETSAGYDCPIVADSGEFCGEKYDFRFDGAMIGNHLALVPNGRCGSDVGVLDKKQENEMDEKQVEKIVADALAKADIGKQVADAVAGIDIGKQVTDAVVSAQAAAQAKADEKAKKDSESDQAKKDAAKKMDARVALHTKLTTILGKKYDSSKSDKDLMVLAIGDTVTDAASKSDEYLSEKIDELAKARADATDFTRTDKSSDTGEIKLSAF